MSEVPNGGERCEREVTGRMGPASVIGIRSVRRVTVYVMPRLVLAIKIRSSEEPGGTRNLRLEGERLSVTDVIIEEVTRIQETGVVRSERRVEFMSSIYMITGIFLWGGCTYHNIRIFTLNGHSKLDFHNKENTKMSLVDVEDNLKVQRTSIIP